MLIIGERINSSRKSIFEAIEKKDIKFIQQEAINQINSGAHMLDINCGTNLKSEKLDMEWLIKIIREVTNVPFVIDSPNPEVIEYGLSIYTGNRVMVNSVTGELKRMEDIFPLVKKYNTDIIALTLDESGMPHTAQQRLNVAKKIINKAKEYGISEEKIYFDCLVRPVSTEPEQILEFLNALKMIKNENPNVKTICGLSNVSFGLPNRKLINSVFVVLCLYNCLDAALIDPTIKEMVSSIYATEVLLNKDEFCLNYITACREGKI